MAFVIIGETGHYDDHVEWPVAVYLERDKAEDHADKAKKRAKEIMAFYGSVGTVMTARALKKPEAFNLWDKEWHYDQNSGIEYYVCEIPFLTIVPES